MWVAAERAFQEPAGPQVPHQLGLDSLVLLAVVVCGSLHPIRAGRKSLARRDNLLPWSRPRRDPSHTSDKGKGPRQCLQRTGWQISSCCGAGSQMADWCETDDSTESLSCRIRAKLRWQVLREILVVRRS